MHEPLSVNERKGTGGFSKDGTRSNGPFLKEIIARNIHRHGVKESLYGRFTILYNEPVKLLNY